MSILPLLSIVNFRPVFYIKTGRKSGLIYA
jgi:hypothetical protein